MKTIALPSAKMLNKRTLTSTAQRSDMIRRAYFANAQTHAKWNVSIELVISQVDLQNVKWMDRVELWIDDAVIACACVRGEQQAWNHLTMANTWKMREAAELRLSPQEALLMVERFWRELRANTCAESCTESCTNSRTNSRTMTDRRRMQQYRGGQTIARWLLSQILGQVESIPLGSARSTRSTVSTILDTMPRLRTLDCEAFALKRMPQAT